MIRRVVGMLWRMSVESGSSACARATSHDLTPVMLHWGCAGKGLPGQKGAPYAGSCTRHGRDSLRTRRRPVRGGNPMTAALMLGGWAYIAFALWALARSS